uniref:HYDIN axonemal central pair apparatus protein n=1 Tax=Anolis carolinensis TaxID=28377 RepID=A0A803TF57_ANOCA
MVFPPQALIDSAKMLTDQSSKPPCPSSICLDCYYLQLTPSAFLKEMSLTTEQRLACTREMRRPRIVQLLDMSETSHQKFSSVDLDQSLFQPFPSEVIFQNFIPCEPYQVPLILRNNDKIPRLVKIVLESSPYFKVISPNDVCNKVAPGMPSTFHILFTPEENKDYFHELTCITEREKFIVPIRALGARGILDFPDQINFSTCPVKYNTQKMLLVRNIGNREAFYQITTQRPFSVEPSTGTLGIKEAAQFTIDFQPEKSGNHCQDLVVHYDTGEDIHVALYGAAADVNVRLDKNSLTVEKTYITLANQRSVVIHNRSDIIAHFQWKAFANPEEEEQKKLCQTLQAEEECLLDQLAMDCHLDPSLREHLAIVTRTFQSRQATVQEDALLFNNHIFSIEPVVRKRRQALGDESPKWRLDPGKKGGPKMLHSLTNHCKENCSQLLQIPSHFSWALQPEAETRCKGGKTNKRPIGKANHRPGGRNSRHRPVSRVLLNFPPYFPLFRRQCWFLTCLLNKHTLFLSPRGCVIGPTFHFDVPSLSFGDVSFGFPSSLSCCLSNTSLVPLTFNLRVPGDGNGLPSVTSQDQATDIFRPSWRRKAGLGGLKPKEFSISPSYGTIRPQGAMDIQVTLCSNTVKSYETALMVDVKGSGEDVLALPITAKCLTPPLCLADPIMNFGHCFLRFPYQRMITLVNDSDLLGCYGVLPQPAESPAILHSSPVPCGIIQPCSTVEIPLTLEVQQRGRQEVTALVAIFGDQDLPLKLQLVTFGEGPVVYVYPAELDFGSIPVLQDVSRVLFLANQSVIPAPFEAQMARPHSLWRIEPSSGIVPPEAEVSLSLIAHLNDTVLFQDKVHLAIEDSTSNIVPVQAAGIGTTIVTDKPFAPAIDLGPHFWYSLGPCFYRFQITNRGRRTHQLYWMTEGFRPFRLRPASLPAIGPSTKGKGPSRQDKVDSQFPVFKLRPLRMELTPGQSLDMQLEASSDTPKVIQEKLICHAIIGKQSGKEFIMTVDVSCQFIAPVLQISSKEITFRVEKNPRDILEAQYEPLALKNVSPLPLSLLLSLQEPFRLCDTDHEKLTAPHQPLLMEVEETRHLCIRFDPLYKDDLYNRAAEEVLTIRYLEHPHIDHINLRGEVYFPNLQFQTMNLDFGCILNDTEMIRDVTMTNCSPLHVKYRWSFLTNEPGCIIRGCLFLLENILCLLMLHISEAGEELSKKSQPETKEPFWCMDAVVQHQTGVEEVFDIMPLFGTLLPKETQKMSFTFYGHADIVARVKALCEVEGGPTYEVFLSGEASLVSYTFDRKEIDYGLQLFNHICVAEIILRNTGKVGFTYSVLDNVWASAENPPPGVPLTLPMTSYIESGKEQVLKIYYLPGIPEVFQRTFRIQVAHLEPDRITLKGEGIFPRICLDLPRNIRGRGNCIGTTIFMIRLLIQEHALEQQWLLAGNNPPEDSVGISQKVRRKLVKAQLPEYILDFGYIILGTVRSHIVKITNTSPFPVSFYADTRNLEDSGFCTGLDRVKNLPFCETETFEVLFDPQSANRPLGEVQVVLPIKVISGPTFNVSFRATVIMPSLCMSNENLEFSAVQCGQCQVETIQLHNQLQVNCEWFAHSSEQMKKVDKHMPAALRRKLRHELKTKPFVFEMIPPYGILVPGERFNVQVKFAPREEKSYRHYMIVSIAQSTQQLILTVSGQGFEPRLEFNPSIVELGPLLPYAAGDEAEVVVKNPCSFPIEFYSLEFDQQYLLEERILRMLKGYDSHHVLLLPPRIPGEKLPPEVLEFYEEQKKIQGDQEAANLDQEEEEEEEGDGIKAQVSWTRAFQLSLVAKQKKAVGELDDNPVSKAIARHLGIDISPEGRAARNRRGIAIIIHGAPLTGKTGAAVTIAKHYNAACLSIDSVVMEAISDRSSSTGLRARELCLRAAIEQAQRENEEGGECLGSRLSGEALPKHLSDGSQQSSESKTGPLSNLSRGYRGSTVTAKGKSDSHGSQKQEKPPPQHLQSDQYSPQVRVPSSTIPGGPMQRRLSLSTSATEGYGLMSCVLPEELLVEILSERMQLSDCYRGIVIDGLETIFARSMTSVLLCLLKAINNRRYIYFVNLAQDFAAMKAKEKSKQEQEEQQEAMAREKARLQEMDEEEYDVLTEEQKIHFDSELLQAVRERKKREQERMARELEEKKHQQELERLREEEEMRKKSKRYKREVAKEKEEAAAAATKKGQQGGKPLNEGVERKSSAKDRAEAGLNDKDEKKKKGKPVLPDGQQAAPLTQEEEEAEKELMSESEKVLAQRFKLYEEAQKDLLQILMFWDRVQLVQLQPPGSEEKAEEVEDQRQAPSGRKGRKDRERERQERLEKERAEKERQERERLERERLEKLKAMEDRAFGQEGEGEGIEIGVPYLEIQVLSSEEASGKSILESGKLPNVVQVLNGLGLGPSGPPIPPTVFFSVIPFPEKRAPPVTGEALKHFTFLTSEELNVEEDKKDTEASSEATSSLPATKVGSKGSKVETWMAGCCSGLLLSPPQKASPPETCFLVSRGSSPCRLNHYRWIVPANGEVTMRLHFSSNTTGLFDQVLNFEIVGTRRQYQLYCRGTCTYPTISTDPTVVFPHRKKTMKPDEMVCKKLVMSTNVFHFGPLLCGKSREKYKASRYPNHFERITILNISPLEAEVHFFFQYDSRAITYLLDPASITLKPNEKQLLTVWAYPTASGIFEDNIVCCIKDNPEPITFRICCQGVRPELELDRRQLHFEKVLLHRKETKPLYLKNATPLPVAWRISGMENIGDDFSLSEDTGIIGPFSEYCLLVNFKASKVLNIKKAIRLEVSDGENILGIVQIENIQIVAEAYDVALDISFPKGTNGGVELGIVRISDEAKQTLSLKNKGKYEIGFSFMVEATDHSMPNLAPMFSIQPQKGNLNPTDRPTQVQIVFRAKREVKIDDKPVLQCQVIEPNFIEGGETIATIPIRLSVHCGYSKYSITPPSLINFGPLMISSRKSSSFTIENKGTLDFKFFILKQIRDIVIPVRKGSRSREVDLSRQNMGRQSKRAESLQKDMNLVAQARFSLGMFTVYPGFGTISPGGHQVITVDCFADQVGKSEEYLIVEVTERDPEDNPAGILYTLVAESCIPGFVTDDPKIIFEEHRICNRSSLSQVLKMVGCEGVFVKDENKFIFTNVLVGSQASARFKIFNNTRIPCDVVLATKPISAKSPVRIADVFDIHPVRMCIPSRSYAFATLNFSPQTMQSYHCIFEASVDAPASVSSKSKHLLFEVSGDGNLPQVTVVRPVLRNKKGAPLLLFRRLLLGHTEMLPLLIKNSGNIPVQLYLDVSDENSAFSLKPTSTTQCTYMNYKTEEHGPSEGGKGKPHTASLFLPIEESAEFEVVFHPSLTQRLEGQIRLSIVDNQYEETRIQMVGEGYQEDVTLDNIRSLMDGGESGSAEEHLGESTAETARLDHIWFGDCIVGKPYQATFTITNHSKTDAMRFEWPALNPHLTFSPQVGHLHASCSKNTILTFKAKAPLCIREQLLKCKVSRIAFPQPADQVPDWDDRQHTVKWVDVSKASGNPRPVIEKDPEPAYLPLEEGGRELELRVSAIVDYAQYKLEVDAVHFKDTLLFQTRVFKVELFNTGNVQLEYSWNVVVDESARLVNFTQGSRPSTQLGSMLESFSSYLFPTPTRPPFLLEPRNGTIPHGRSQILQVKFSPQEVGEFEGRLICSILNLKAEEVGPVVTVKGKGLLPYCHFDLEDSDYITAKRRNPELRGPGGAGLAPDTKVIEFTSVGVHVRNTNFVIMNPTNTPYSFHWTCQQQQQKGGQDPPVFICFTDRGQLRPEKTMEIIFEFIPRHVDITESFWSFSIPELGIVVPFLLVGHTTDPEVYLDRPHLNFHSLLVGHEARESVDIINNEKDTYSFSFRDSSRFSEGRINSLKVHPMEGSILPSSRVPVTIFFTPTLEGEVNFNLLCDVKSKSQPLCLNVKATGHAMSVSVKRQRSDGSMKELDPDQTNRLPFHEMQVNDFTQYHFYILNTGKFNFFFSWEFCHAKAVQRYFAIAPETAVVEVGERGLLISHGPTFTCALQGVVVAPSLHFSFTKVDFGNCFIYHAGMPILKRTLIITNKDKKVVSLNCLFTNTAYLELSFRTEVLSPGGKVEIPISFYPREAVSYHEVITFEINGLLQRTVEVSGKGIEMKIEVVEPRSKVMKFGAVPLGHTVKKMATIVNNSVAFVTFQLNFVSSVPELHDAKVLTMSPSGEIALNPKGDTCHVEVTFAPRNRLLPFTEEVIFECQGVLRTLFAIQGCSQGIQVSLDQDHVPFGAVVLRSQATRRIVMQNTGDLGVGFKWEAKRFKPDFSIRPLEGYISPGMDVAFEVTFHPCELSPDICYENLPCHIQGGEPLRLTLTGCCVGVPAVKEVVNFICQVRAKHTQTIMLTNRTNQPWTLQPIIEGEQWKGAEFIRVEAHQQNKPYEITYRPLAMNAENKKDQGSVFFPLPDGTGLLYLLQGTAEPPKSAGNIMREVPCKTTYTELLPVSNWLSKPQRFRVTIDMLKPEKLEVTTTLKTLDYLEVPASAKKDHKLTFYSYREGIFSAKVTFRNESTQEFLFYLLTFKATPCGPLGTIELTSPVRQIVSSSVKVENPLSSPVTFSTDCKVPDINMPSQFVVPAQSEGVLAFDFQPMRVGESGGRLALNSTDLGSFQYDLVLKATPPRAEKTLHFSAMLGSSQNIVAKFVNYTRQKTEYSTKIDCPDFHVDKVVNAPAGSQGGSEVGVEVTFEPCQLGESQGTLALSSPIGGDYVIPLCGTCVPPRPQGPIQIKAGTATTIPFKNVFLQSMSFTYLVEHPAFTIKATETIRSKKSASIVVSFEGTPGSNKAPVTSRLVVSCPRAAGLGARVSWVYYLKGIVPEK